MRQLKHNQQGTYWRTWRLAGEWTIQAMTLLAYEAYPQSNPQNTEKHKVFLLLVMIHWIGFKIVGQMTCFWKLLLSYLL